MAGRAPINIAANVMIHRFIFPKDKIAQQPVSCHGDFRPAVPDVPNPKLPPNATLARLRLALLPSSPVDKGHGKAKPS